MAGNEDIDDPHLRHLFDGEDSMNVYSSKVTNLSAGAPGPDLLSKCISMFSEATDHRMKKECEDAFLFQYGITSGLWEFRDQLASFLTIHYGDPVKRADLVLTCGATHGLQLVMGTFLDPGAIIFVEEVTYMIALDAFQQYPLMRVVSVPMTSDGVDAQALGHIASVERTKWKACTDRPFWAMFYTIPMFHNPSGCTMSKQCCQDVVDVARKLDLLVLCDDVYNLLYYGKEKKPPTRLFAYDQMRQGPGHIVSNGTFSKIMAPGVRVGWLELPPQLALLLRNSGILRSGGAVNQYTSGIVASLLELDLASKHLRFLVDTYKGRMFGLCDTLERNLPEGCSFARPEGGYFVWIELPSSVNSAKFTSWCQEKYQVSAIHGSRFDFHGQHTNFLRLSIAFHKEATLVKAAETLCQALKEFVVQQVSE